MALVVVQEIETNFNKKRGISREIARTQHEKRLFQQHLHRQTALTMLLMAMIMSDRDDVVNVVMMIVTV